MQVIYCTLCYKYVFDNHATNHVPRCQYTYALLARHESSEGTTDISVASLCYHIYCKIYIHNNNNPIPFHFVFFQKKQLVPVYLYKCTSFTYKATLGELRNLLQTSFCGCW